MARGGGPSWSVPVTRRRTTGFAWRFWTLPWPSPSAGEHTITSRAIDVDGNVQPPPDDPFLVGRQTYWEANGWITRQIDIPYAPGFVSPHRSSIA